MMYAELYQYLIQHKKLPVPGIGTFLLERKPAELIFPTNRLIRLLILHCNLRSHIPGKNFFNWLAQCAWVFLTGMPSFVSMILLLT